MTDTPASIAALVQHFEQIEQTHMRGLPILNPRLAVEATAVRAHGEHLVCILISPWFMNLVLLPGTDAWADSDQGECSEIKLPRESLEFNVCHDDNLGTFLTAVLFRTVSDFPDQDTARGVAMGILEELFTTDTASGNGAGTSDRKTISRRSLLTGLAAG